jgi:hypothetical protein
MKQTDVIAALMEEAKDKPQDKEAYEKIITLLLSLRQE